MLIHTWLVIKPNVMFIKYIYIYIYISNVMILLSPFLMKRTIFLNFLLSKKIITQKKKKKKKKTLTCRGELLHQASQQCSL